MAKPNYRAGSKPNATGRSDRDAKHVRLYDWLLNSAAYRDLRPVARALIVEMARLYNGRNNGEIALGEREAAIRLGMADRAAARRALAELQAHGFITPTKASSFALKDRSARRATEWRLEWQPTGGRIGQPEIPPTKAFMHWPKLPPKDV
jgi:hypothetical protein